MQSIDFESGPVYPTTPRVVSIPGGSREELARCPYFVVDRWRIREPVAVGSTDRFTILLGLRGSAEVRHEEQDTSVDFGQTLLLPAALGSCVLTPRDGEATVLACSVP
jgi:mannose-6-phosphate isomerase